MRQNESSRSPREPRKPRGRTLLIGAVCTLAAALALVAVLTLHRRASARKIGAQDKGVAQAGLEVDTAKVTLSAAERTLLLLGEARPYYSVTLYARVSGFMDRLLADIGDRVRAGQVLAHVESPEQEQSYAAARADAVNKRRIARRMRVLRRRKLVSPQQEEQTASDAQVSEATLRTQEVLRGYQDVVAPFDGVISNRFVDPGALLQNASGSQSASQPLFTITDADPLRVFMYIDQRDAPYVHAGDPAVVYVGGLSHSGLRASVTRVAAELDPQTRTLLAELLLPDPKREVSAGSYVSVRMTVRTPQLFKLPVQALIMRQDKPYLAVIQQGDRVRFRGIDLAENDGEQLLIRAGVRLGEEVALNVGDRVEDGARIQRAQRQAVAP